MMSTSSLDPSRPVASTNNTSPLRQTASQQDPEYLSPLESSLLSEYARLASNLSTLNTSLGELADGSRPITAQILDELRGLERKTGLVCTLLKASVYSIVLQQEVWAGNGDGAGHEDEGGDGGR